MAKTFSVGGVNVNPISPAIVSQEVKSRVDEKKTSYVCITGAHGIVESQKDENLKRIHNEAGLVVPDGKPLVFVGRALGFKDMQRCYGPDLMLSLCDFGQNENWKHYLYGGGDGVTDELERHLKKRFPAIEIVGKYTPPFRELGDEEILERAEEINQSGANIVWVGLSTPKQEKWMARMAPHVNGVTMFGCGAAFDFNANLKSKAPKWIGESGLEWLYRLITEPRRLWKRYLWIVPVFAFLSLFKLKRNV